MGGARQLIGLLVYPSSLRCNDEKRSSGKAGRDLEALWERDKLQRAGEESKKTWGPALGRGCLQLPPVPRSALGETWVQGLLSSVGAALAARHPTDPALLCGAP